MARKARPSTPIDPGAIPWLLAVALATAAPHAGALAQLADRTSFDRRWALAISNMKG